MIYIICILLIAAILVKIIYDKMELLTNRNKNTNTKTKTKTNTILFVNSKEIDDIFNKINYKDYIKKFNKNEVHHKIKNLKDHGSLYEGYVNNILDFTEEEKIFIKKCVTNLNKIKIIKKLGMTNWKIIKTNTNIEWGFSFTYDKYIFISDKTIYTYMHNNNFEGMMKLLLHEQSHILQRYNQEIFNNNLYKNNWNFIKSNIYLDKALEDSIVTNPDGLDKYIFIGKK